MTQWAIDSHARIIAAFASKACLRIIAPGLPMKLFRRTPKDDANKAPAIPPTEAIPPAEPAPPVPASQPVVSQPSVPAVPEEAATEKAGLFSRLKKGLGKTGAALGEGLGNLVLGRKEIDQALLDELEMQLLVADLGIETTRDVLAALTKRIGRRELADGDALYRALQEELAAILAPCAVPLPAATQKPQVILVVGINGAGKTTTIGKLAHRLKAEGKHVMLAAGDTFRAAAVEQLKQWGERNDVPVIAQHTGADSASVIFDAVQAAQSRHVDVLLADTAGRLHNKSNLMEELKKVVRVMQKLDATAPHEVLLVLDAGTGQNALAQAREFGQAVGVTGIALTKLDGTAKGGIIFAIARQLNIPIRFIGIGEKAEDLRPFEAGEFVRALFAGKA